MQKFLVNRWVHFSVLFLLLLAAVSFSYSDQELRTRLQYVTFDNFNNLYPRKASNEVRIVDLDEISIRYLGQWPWPRQIVAKLVTRLNDLGAKVIAFDVVFSEPDRTSPKFFLKELSDDPSHDSLKEKLKLLEDHDNVFAEAISNSGNVVTGFSQARPTESLRAPKINSSASILFKGKGDESAVMTETFLNDALDLKGVVTNIPELSNVSAGNGAFVATPDIDGIIRQVSLFMSFPNPNVFNKKYDDNGLFQHLRKYEPTLYPMLSLEALRVFEGSNARYMVVKNESKDDLTTDYQLGVREFSVPIESNSKMWVYYRHIDDDEYISAYKVLDPAYEEEVRSFVNEKIILVGTSAEGLRDIRSTPLDVFVPGVEVHLNVIEQILQGKFLLRPAIVEFAEAVAIFLIGILIIILAPFLGVIALAVISFSASFVGFAWAVFAYKEMGVLFDPVYPAFCVSIIFFVSSILTYLRSESERKQVREAFGLYISPEFMEELASDPDKLQLGGETKDLTVMFTDIRNFTSISERLSPGALIQLMNDFLTPMSDLVMEHRGTIDKFMGDAMMAFWNAPLDDENHAANACMAALKMNKALDPINEELKKQAAEEGKDPIYLEAGIGVNTGPSSVGNMGSKQRFAYSALGDTVNLSSRLEGQTKQYGVRILVGEKTRNEAPDFAMLELDLIRVKGKLDPERIFVLLGDKEMLESEYFITWKSKHDKMLAAYREMDWDEATSFAKECLVASKEGMSEFYKMFIERIEAMKQAPPEKGWDGVFVATTK